MTRLDPATVAAAALSGDWSAVRVPLEDRAADGVADAYELGLLASACLATGDATLAEAAADHALMLDAGSLRAALVKADLLWSRGEAKEANFFYRALADRNSDVRGMEPDLVDGITRARSRQSEISAGLYDRVRATLKDVGFSEGRSSARFQHALDLATGRRQAYLQQPRAFYFPELAPIQFFPRDQFPWLDRVEAAVGPMTAELEKVLGGDEAFSPYIQSVSNMPTRTDYPLIDSLDWSACFLMKDGAETPFAGRCPETMNALRDVPLCRVKGRSPQVMFSQLRAGAHIQPHCGFVNTRLVCHVPLIVPPGCHFRVGNETRSWIEGKAWVFDDTIEHEAMNRSDRTRVVLIFDIWRPELTEEERLLVATLLETVDAYSPQRTAWE